MGKGVRRWEEREILYLSLHCHHQNDFCIKMGSDESHFNVSVVLIGCAILVCGLHLLVDCTFFEFPGHERAEFSPI